jgi:outer membrane receptor protein involved in Fe transport
MGEFDVNTFGYTLTLTKDFEQFGMLSYGGDYYYDDIDSSRVRRANDASPFVPRDPQYPDDSRYDRAGAYVNWDLQATERLNLNAGVRYENINAHGTPTVTIDGTPTPFTFDRTYQDWVGSVGFVYEVDPVLNFVGGVHEGFRAPTIDDLASDKTFLQNSVNVPTLGSLNVQPEHSTTYEVGLKLDAPRVRGQVYQWYTELDDYITRVPDVNNVVVFGNSDASLHGTELAGEFLIDPQWSLYGNVWYTWGRDTVANTPYPRIPPTQGVLGLRWRDEGRRSYADLFTWMVADFDTDRYAPGNIGDARFPTNGQPGYATLNLRLGHSFGERDNHRVSLSLLNMTDKYYRVIGSGVDGEGFNAILGYEFLH